MAEIQVKRIADILEAARRQKEVAALLVPRRFAEGLVDELFPLPAAQDMSLPDIDAYYQYVCTRAEKARGRYIVAVENGGVVGTIFDVPMIVDDDCVICALDEGELYGYAESYQVDLSDLHTA